MSRRGPLRRWRRVTVSAISVAGVAAAAIALALQSGDPAAPSESIAEAGKPVAPFTVEHALAEPPAVGAPLRVHLILRAQRQVDDVAVELAGDEGRLNVDPRDLTLTAASVAPEQPAEWTVAVTPLDTGLLRLRIYVEALVDGRRQGSSVVVPIRVGEASGEAAKTSSTARAESEDRAKPARSGSATEPREPPNEENGSERVIRLPASDPR